MYLPLYNNDPMMTVGTLKVVAGVGMDGVTAVVEHLDLRQEETSHWQQGVCPGQFNLSFCKDT